MTHVDSDVLTLPDVDRMPSTSRIGDDDSYGVDLLGSIHTLLQGYSGGISIVRELTQNADDAPGTDDRWLEFHFLPGKLLVRNSSRFRDEDFKRIKRVASGQKIFDEQKTTGAFGVGFVSVYQLTDTPILRSSGWEVRFLPELGKAPPTPCAMVDCTEFELPYRRERTVVGDRLGMDVITDEWIRTLIDHELPREVPALLFFQRKLQRMTIYEDEQQVLEVRRSIVPATRTHAPEQITITTVHRGMQAEYHWFRFSGSVQGDLPRRSDNRPEKDSQVQIVVPDLDVPLAAWQHAGRLYNYLPTDIPTKLPFHINGDFYPSTDRKDIDMGHDRHRAWNERVLHALGDCFADALPYLLEHFADAPLRLYQRLPLTSEVPIVDKPIVQRFYEKARVLPVFYTFNGWRTAQETRWVRQELRPVVEHVDQRLMNDQLQRTIWPLINKARVPEYTLDDLLRRIQADIAAGQALRDGPSYLNTRQQLERLYALFEQDIARQSQALISRTPVFIDQTGRLWTADQCVRTTNRDILQGLADSKLHFWNGDVERYAYTAKRVAEFRLVHLWNALRQDLSAEGLEIANAPAWLDNRDKLYKLYRTIIATREPIEKSDVTNLSLCVSRDERLYSPTRLYMPAGEPRLYDILADDPGAPLVHKLVQEHKDYRRLYEDLGVRVFTWKILIDRLSVLASRETTRDQAHPCLNSPEKLIILYRYLNDHRSDIAGEPVYMQKLRQALPIWLCQDGMLRYAQELTLFSEAMLNSVPACIVIDRVLARESYTGMSSLFTEVLGLRPLDTERFIEQYLLPQYANLPDDRTQVDALKYLRERDTVELLKSRPRLARLVTSYPLIRGHDNRLYSGGDLCFYSPRLRELFGDTFHTPHQTYFESLQPGEEYRSLWYTLFDFLGVRTFAPAALIEQAIENLQQHKPQFEHREKSEKLFRYLETNWRNYSQASTLVVKLRNTAWLPADGDETRWYRPCDLYPVTDKRLVDRVARVLGFHKSLEGQQRPSTEIANALGFPNKVENSLIVQQLLKLALADIPAHPTIYERLSGAKDEELKPLYGQSVIYDNTNTQYRRAEEFFLDDYRQEFGSFRPYYAASSTDNVRRLLEKLGAKQYPQLWDYVALIESIAKTYPEFVPANTRGFVINAYQKLSDASASMLQPLRKIGSVLSQTASEKQMEQYRLRRPDTVVLRPPQRYLDALPGLPIAQYVPGGEQTLRTLGVRSLEDEGVLKTELAVDLQTESRFSVSQYFYPLVQAVRRLLYHYGKQYQESAIWSCISALQGYEVSSVQVMYYVYLDDQIFSSELQNEHAYYDQAKQHMYLCSYLKGTQHKRAIAQILHQIIDIDSISLSLLVSLIAEPMSVEEILDYERIQPLPDEVKQQPYAVDPIPTMQIGTTSTDEDELPATDEQVDAAEWQADDHVADAGADVFDKTHVRNIPETPDADQRERQPEQAGMFTPSEEVPPPAPSRDKRNEAKDAQTPTARPDRGSPPAHPKTDSRSGNGKDAPSSRSSAHSAPTQSNGKQAPHGEHGIPDTPFTASQPSDPPKLPPFRGRSKLSSPRISTDMDGLCDRVRRYAERENLPLTSNDARVIPPPPPSFTPATAAAPAQINVARFVLSYPEVHDGFLRLTGQARQLFAGQPTQVTCQTDDQDTFMLYLDWNRDTPIAYNQQALPDFFAQQEIPAGGIVYLERRHAAPYRLYFNESPHTVREVRIASIEADDGQVQVRYETIDETEVRCETVEAIYRAEKRHEDQQALWLEAVGKKSVMETLCDLLMASPTGYVHEEELHAILDMERMVAAGTVAQTLRKHDFFEDVGNGYWQFNPAKLLTFAQNDDVRHWCKTTDKLLTSDDSLLADSLEVIQPRFSHLHTRLLQVGTAALIPGTHTDSGLAAAMQHLNANPHDIIQRQNIADILRQCVMRSKSDLVQDESLQGMIRMASADVRRLILASQIQAMIAELRTSERYQRAAELAQWWTFFEPDTIIDIANIVAEAEAWKQISDSPTVEEVLRALQHAPTLVKARKKLHVAVQRELQMRSAKDWLPHGKAEQVVQAFYAYVAAVAQARPELQKDDQHAFDLTVQHTMGDLWNQINSNGKLLLAVQLTHYAPTAHLTDQQLRHLVPIIQQMRQQQPLVALLLGMFIWRNCPAQHYLQDKIATHLAHCHLDLKIYELVLNRPWKSLVAEPVLKSIRSHLDEATHMQREDVLLKKLNSDSSPLIDLLTVERRDLHDMLEKDIRLLASSASS